MPTRAERRDLERHDRFRLKRIQAPRDIAVFKNLEPGPAWRGSFVWLADCAGIQKTTLGDLLVARHMSVAA